MEPRKKRYGMKQVLRTQAQIDQEYSAHAVQVGHKMRIIDQLEDEINLHREKLKQLVKEKPAQEKQETPAQPQQEAQQ